MNESEARYLWLEFLKSLTRAMVQANLYHSNHPQVKEAVNLSMESLEKIFSSGENLILSMSQDNLIVNSIPVLPADKIPNSLKNSFKKFNLASITFQKGVSREEIKNFCRLQHSKTGLADFVKNNDLSHILFNKDIYRRVDEKKNRPAREATAAELAGEVSSLDLENSVRAIAKKITPDENESRALAETILRKAREETEKQVKKLVERYTREKQKAENDAVRTRGVMSNMAEGVVVVNDEGQIVLMNEEAQTISGKSLKEVAGRKIFDVTDLENQVLTLSKEIKEESARPVVKDIMQKGADSLLRTMKKATAIIQNEEGKIVGTVSIPSDRAKLKEVETMKNEFVASVTHELRSPLTSLKASLEVLAAGEGLDDSGRSVLSTAVRNAERLNSIINDILDFSKLESGKMTFHLAPENPGHILDDAYESMKAWADSKKINFARTLQENTPRIYADKTRAAQVLINLLSNAIKFTPQGGKIEIDARKGEENLSEYIVFSVKDNGCGIKKEEQKKLFGKFVQLASVGKTGGAGLGLSLAKAMTVMQGGRIFFESREGAGSVFSAAFPVYKKSETGETPVPLKKSWWKKLLGI